MPKRRESDGGKAGSVERKNAVPYLEGSDSLGTGTANSIACRVPVEGEEGRRSSPTIAGARCEATEAWSKCGGAADPWMTRTAASCRLAAVRVAAEVGEGSCGAGSRRGVGLASSVGSLLGESLLVERALSMRA